MFELLLLASLALILFSQQLPEKNQNNKPETKLDAPTKSNQQSIAVLRRKTVL